MIDRVAAARLGVTVTAIDDALNNAFSQRQVSIIYTERNQYRVVLEVDPALQTDPMFLNRIFVGSSNGTQVPLGSVTRLERDTASLAVHHQGPVPGGNHQLQSGIGGVAEGDALAAVQKAADDLHMPETVRAEFAGNAKFLAQSLASQPYLIAAAFLAIYIILGVLYESLAQPLTIISTLPSAGLGALLSLLLTGLPLSIMGIIGILLLMGIVKKNAIMLVDFALEQERRHGCTPFEGHPRRLHRAIPADHHDDAGGDARRAPVGAVDRDRIGIAPAAGRIDLRRARRQPGADALHDPGHLSAAAAQGEAPRRRDGRRGGSRVISAR